MTEICTMASGIDQAYAVCLVHNRAMVMCTDHEIDTSKRPEKVHPLIFKLRTVPVACSCMSGNYDHVRILLPSDHVDLLLSKRKKRQKIHPFPYFRREPALDIGIRKAYDCNLEPSFLQAHIILEIRPA